MLTTIAGIIALLVAALVAYGALQPGSFEVTRTARINAAPGRIFPHIANLRQMNTWLPFVKPDPNISLTYSGPESGSGAVNEFSGNNQVGAGRVEITESVPPSHVTMRLQMTRPIACDNRIVFTLAPAGASTDVTWAMSGKSSFLVRMMCLFMNHDKMVGGQFEKGLADLKAIAER